MQKRTAAVLLSLTVLLMLGLLVWIVWPLFVSQPKSTQPAPLPGQINVSSTVPTTGQTAPTNLTAPVPTATNSALSPAEQERQAQEALLRQAGTFSERVGSYSNLDEFSSMNEVYSTVTDGVRSYLEGLRADLVKQHPAAGASWGQTTVAVSTRIESGKPILTSTAAEVVVQVQRTTDDAGKQTTSYWETNLSYTKVNGAWTVSRITWTPFKP